MFENDTVRKCTQCAGVLEYIKNKELWVCPYCGAEYGGTEKNSREFSVKSAVLRSLSDITECMFASAYKNIEICEEKAPSYAGTLIAGIALRIVENRTESRLKHTEFGITERYEELKEISTGIGEDEAGLYESISDPDVYATLLYVFYILHDILRCRKLESLFNPSRVKSPHANLRLLTYSLKNRNYFIADTIISNTGHIDAHASLGLLLSFYPSGPEKLRNVKILFDTGLIGNKSRSFIDDYVFSSSDDIKTKTGITAFVLSRGIRTDMKAIIKGFLENAGTEDIRNVISAYIEARHDEKVLSSLIEDVFACGSEKTLKTVLYIIKQKGIEFSVPVPLLYDLLNSSDITEDKKLNIVYEIINYSSDTDVIENTLSRFILSDKNFIQSRAGIIKYILRYTENISSEVFIKYILESSCDAEGKPEIAEAVLRKVNNRQNFENIISDYLYRDTDSIETKCRIISVLANNGIKISADLLDKYIL